MSSSHIFGNLLKAGLLKDFEREIVIKIDLPLLFENGVISFVTRKFIFSC